MILLLQTYHVSIMEQQPSKHLDQYLIDGLMPIPMILTHRSAYSDPPLEAEIWGFKFKALRNNEYLLVWRFGWVLLGEG